MVCLTESAITPKTSVEYKGLDDECRWVIRTLIKRRRSDGGQRLCWRRDGKEKYVSYRKGMRREDEQLRIWEEEHALSILFSRQFGQSSNQTFCFWSHMNVFQIETNISQVKLQALEDDWNIFYLRSILYNFYWNFYFTSPNKCDNFTNFLFFERK